MDRTEWVPVMRRANAKQKGCSSSSSSRRKRKRRKQRNLAEFVKI